jgi:hypothetical protein
MKYPADVTYPTEPQIQQAQPQDREAYLAYQREVERVKCWHETYNAAVTGLFARDNLSEDVIHLAKEFADATHGPL